MLIFFASIRSFFLLFVFSIYIVVYILNIAKAIKKISVNEIKDFIFENYYKKIVFSKENSSYSMEYLKKKVLLLLEN